MALMDVPAVQLLLTRAWTPVVSTFDTVTAPDASLAVVTLLSARAVVVTVAALGDRATGRLLPPVLTPNAKVPELPAESRQVPLKVPRLMTASIATGVATVAETTVSPMRRVPLGSRNARPRTADVAVLPAQSVSRPSSWYCEPCWVTVSERTLQ